MSIMPYKDKEKRKAHHRKYMREIWYPLNKNKHIKYVSNLKQKIAEFVLDFKKNKECVDCGFKGLVYPQVLEFDHLGSDKKFNISEYGRITSSINKVRHEISKCDIVCANCHRIRTVKRKNCRRSSGSRAWDS
jgi:hypothetical protein